MAIRVGVVDDHELFLRGVRACLDETSGIEVAGIATDIISALRFIGADQPDVLIVNADLAHSGAVALCRQVHGVFPNIALLAIAEHPNPARTRLFQSIGVRGYIETTVSCATLAAAVRMVAAGERVYAAQAAEGLGDRPTALTAREVQVLELLAAGHSNPADTKNRILQDYFERVKAARIPYSAFGLGANSNSFAAGALRYLGLTPPEPPVAAPGWNIRLGVGPPGPTAAGSCRGAPASTVY